MPKNVGYPAGMVGLDGFFVDLRYACADNFTKKALLAPGFKAIARQEAVLALRCAGQRLSGRGLFLTVWDAWRPDRVQMELWKAFPAERFVSVPLGMGGVGSAHSRGVAFDVTLCSEDGGFLAMPTGFDDFNSPLANPKASGSGPEFERRDLLQEAMAGAGFLGADSEWWHFQLAGWEGFGVVECDWNKMPVDGEGRMSPR